MNEDLKTLLGSDPRYRPLLKEIAAHPYVERQALAKAVGLFPADLDELLATLTERMLVLELATQADSSVESRVPRKAYLINPDQEREIRAFIESD